MKLTIQHRYDFADRLQPGSLSEPEGWDALRESDGTFGLPGTREAWAFAAGSYGLAPRAAAIAATARNLEARRLCSYGVGVAYVEKNIHDLDPELDLTCTDFTPGTIARLRGLFPEASFVLHDLRHDPPLEADLHLFHRIDTELSDAAWRDVFARYPVPILFVAGEILDVRRAVRELMTRVLHPNATDAGWIRTSSALRALWGATHIARSVPIDDLGGYLLMPR